MTVQGVAMNPTQGVSYPRSGFAIAWHLAVRYYGDALVFCDSRNTRWCGCEQVPCVNPRRTFAKNHDFDVYDSPGVPILASERYLIQYRTPVHSICSNFHLHCRNQPDRSDLDGWRRFASKSIRYWNNLIDKWVIGLPPLDEAPLFCRYHDLVADPFERSHAILDFLGTGPVDEGRLHGILESHPIAPRDSIASFPYRDTGFFDELQAQAGDRITKLDLPDWKDA